MKRKVHSKIPKFSVLDIQGKEFTEKSLLGKKAVLFIYPKDNTPGCTKEACDFTENLEEFQKLDTAVYGLSPDTVTKHKKFIESKKLKISLLSDEKKVALNALGVIKKKKMFGKEYLGVSRTSFIIDEKGKILEIFENVKVLGHVSSVLNKLKELHS